VDGKDINTAYPITNQIGSETRDEFVAFQDAQVLPLFVLSKQNNLFIKHGNHLSRNCSKGL